MSEHRQFTRIEFDADTRVSQGEDVWSVELMDISLNGVLFKQPNNWLINPGKPLFVNIHLSDQSIIKMECQLVHTTEDEVGCQCKHIDLDSITLLKRLIELNVGSEDMLERELSALIQ